MGLGGTPAGEDMLAMRGRVYAVRMDGAERFAVCIVDAFSEAGVRYCCCLCCVVVMMGQVFLSWYLKAIDN